MRSTRPALVAAALAAAGGVVVAGAGAASGGQSRAELTAGDLPGLAAADQAVTIASEGWQRLTRRPVSSLRPLGGAHPGTKSIRVNRPGRRSRPPAAASASPTRRGTVIVKTATRDGALSLVAIMRKVRAGAAPSSWRFAEYTRSRSGDGFTKVGGGQSLCRSCHVQALDVQRSDWVFFRLAPALRGDGQRDDHAQRCVVPDPAEDLVAARPGGSRPRRSRLPGAAFGDSPKICPPGTRAPILWPSVAAFVTASRIGAPALRSPASRG